MKFLLLTLSTTHEKTLVRADSIVFATSEISNDIHFTRIYLEKVQIKDDDIACLDVQESVETIYNQIKE